MRKLTSLKTACVALVFCATAIASAQTFTTLASFNSTFGNPAAGLVQGFDGNFYGTTTSNLITPPPVLFEITPAGTLTAPFTFPGEEFGQSPLIQASNGNFYGITFTANSPGSFFELTPSGTYTTLYNFCAQTNCSDGSGPLGIVQGTDGNFYGTTYSGGVNNLGTFFEISPAGNLATLHSFAAGEVLGGTLRLQASDGNFYGTSYNGNNNGPGAVFMITLAGQVTTLYDFCAVGNCYDGRNPNSLVQATDGSFYGTTLFGGIGSAATCYLGGCGTIFRITPEGKFKTLHKFNLNDSAAPNSLLQATDGNLYGTTAGDGRYSVEETGSVFKFQPRSGILTTLHFFSYTDGADAQALMQATNGTFYGTTQSGGPGQQVGTVFSVSAGLAPFVETLPTSAKVGAKVVILGNSLTGTTAVTFNGIAARFTVVSDTEIKTQVPAGATTGTVKAGTPGGTLSSNVAFQVTP
jgi:uncharacterized repeat protein (TIGR03803 family)